MRTSAPIRRLVDSSSFEAFIMTFLETERARIFNSPDNNLYIHVGYFITWFNSVDWRLSILTAVVLGYKDFAALDQVMRGLDAETKARRLVGICKVKNLQIDKSFEDQLDYFSRKICGLRNKLAHRALVIDESKDRFHYTTLDKMPWMLLGESGYKGPPPDYIDAIQLFERGYWLNAWADDLTDVTDRARDGRSLGIDHPRARVPKAAPSSPRPPTSSPTPDKPPGKAPETGQ
jgi:hypothetical protein